MTDPAHQRFIDDAALGAKVREFVWDKVPIAPLIRCKQLEAQVAALTAERDALLAARPVPITIGGGAGGSANAVSQTTPVPKFKAGQRVRFVSKVASAHDGAVGTIVTVRPDGLFVVGFRNWMLDGCYAEDQLAPEGAQP